ncbi:MAG: RluA family pseudouridine synthase, partial [Pseudomonadales bacterium]|nr:RluA family pseudouridine synthase [Pseudomonadales bacterium]
IDNFLISELKGAPRSLVYRILRKGEVRVNKGRVKPDYRLMSGDVVRVPPVKLSDKTQPVAGDALITHLKKCVLFEDQDFLVINKPSGLAVHGGSGNSLGLIEALRQSRPDCRYLELVHRLDKETSGCLLVAKKRSVLRSLQDLFRQKKITKTYLALVKGHWPANKRRVTAPLLKTGSEDTSRYVKVHEDGKASKTGFELIQHFRDFSLVRALPQTGRTHQIRVHAKSAGHPLVGDDKYAPETVVDDRRISGCSRLFLHAASLSFIKEGADKVFCVEAPLPDELQKVLRHLESGR